MDVLATATGKTYQCNYFNTGGGGNRLSVQLVGVDIPAVAAVFCDSRETMQLSRGVQHAVGYTSLVAIMPEGNDVRIILRRP